MASPLQLAPAAVLCRDHRHSGGFIGAYVVEKGRGYEAARGGLQFARHYADGCAGVVPGLSCIFLFTAAWNPLFFLCWTMAILVISAITRF